MFGGSNVQSSWTNPQQNQQQQQQQPQGSVFGQPNAFGSGTFGTTGGAFGQPPQQQQQQQPAQANPMFGNLSSTPQSTPAAGGTGFGAFGNTNNSSAFGTKPANSGFGAFGTAGGTSAFGSGGGGFGAAANTQGSAFGQPNTGTSNAFGAAGGGLFGNKPAGNAFGGGSTTAVSATGSFDTVAPVTTGSSNPPWSVFSEKDAANPTVTIQYQSITCMPPYRGTSFEELRFQDYAQGRKTASTGGSFGQTPAFGSTSQSTPAAGLFGQPAQQPAQQNAFGAFGANNATPAANAGGLFGSTQGAAAGGFGAFGQTQQQQPATTNFGAFGQPQPQQQPQASSGLFGGGNNAFGNNQAKPAGSAFGGTGGGFGNTGTGGSLFTQNTNNQQAPAGTGLFGQPQQNTGSAFGSGAFGANQQKPLFGAQPAQPATGFGAQPTAQAPQQAQAGGLFGGGSLFGGQNSQQPQQSQQSGGLFGNTQPNQQQTSGRLFGGGGGGGGLFGASNQQNAGQQQPQSGGFGLFSAPKPAVPAAGGGLFGGGTGNTGGLFGQSNNATQAVPQTQSGSLFGSLGQSTSQSAQNNFGGGSLFGPKPAPATGFQQNGLQNLGGSLFGNSLSSSALGAPAGGAPGSLQASVAQPVSTNLPIFSMLPPTATNSSVEHASKKKSSLFEMPVKTPIPGAMGFQPSSQRLRGYASVSRAGTPNSSSLSFNLTQGKPNVLNFSATNLKGSTDPFNSSALLGSGSKSSVKKLILDKKVDAAQLLKRSSATPSPGKASFNPALSVAAREKEALAVSTFFPDTSAPSPRRGTRFGQTSPDAAADGDGVDKRLEEGDYWSHPSVSALSKLGYEQLAAVKNLVVGRVGYGELKFLEPVDLTTLAKLGDLLGEQVRFDSMECSVYPEIDDVDKPPPGSGLNVRGRITLLGCWPLDKASRQPIKDATHPSAIKHLKRLKAMKDTTFESFDLDEGRWTFIVEHF